jgi:hypothetical protein
VAAVALVLATLAIPVTVDGPAELARVRFGGPVPFIKQNLSELVAMGGQVDFPYHTPFLSPWEFSADFSMLAFLVDVAVVWACLILVAAGRARRRQRQATVR